MGIKFRYNKRIYDNVRIEVNLTAKFFSKPPLT